MSFTIPSFFFIFLLFFIPNANHSWAHLPFSSTTPPLSLENPS